MSHCHFTCMLSVYSTVYVAPLYQWCQSGFPNCTVRICYCVFKMMICECQKLSFMCIFKMQNSNKMYCGVLKIYKGTNCMSHGFVIQGVTLWYKGGYQNGRYTWGVPHKTKKKPIKTSIDIWDHLRSYNCPPPSLHLKHISFF